jgi:hypothetical protein
MLGALGSLLGQAIAVIKFSPCLKQGALDVMPLSHRGPQGGVFCPRFREAPGVLSCPLFPAIFSRATHPERRVGCAGVVVVDPAGELLEDALRRSQVGIVNIVAA